MRENYSRLYTDLHRNPKYFRGHSIKAGLSNITALVAEHQPRTILDYGCGKGLQYTLDRVHEQWGGPMPTLYDVGVTELSARPSGPFDAVICTDVMEHISEHDVDAVLDDIFGFLPMRGDGGTSFAYFYIACRPAKKKKLADGRNVHLTVKEPSWWAGKFTARQRKGLVILSEYDGDAN